MVTCGNRNQTFVSIKRLVCTIIRTKNISEMFVLYHKICHIKYLITEGEISYWYVPEHYAILLYIQFHISVLKSRVCATKTLSKSIQPWKNSVAHGAFTWRDNWCDTSSPVALLQSWIWLLFKRCRLIRCWSISTSRATRRVSFKAVVWSYSFMTLWCCYLSPPQMHTWILNKINNHKRRNPAHYVPFNIIIWYVSKPIYFT